ncbi:hypothetical protein JTE90_004246 [Oedothorax gibbosus]|uniref:Uncharacterized protein n=1 Tax=Oedothorax gibbosus TaxID=931172 RepID=A0AAV6UEN5_9ARAC|nr:hypothetical protein JTE90_004246 [Oedothorax gibbosus]
MNHLDIEENDDTFSKEQVKTNKMLSSSAIETASSRRGCLREQATIEMSRSEINPNNDVENGIRTVLELSRPLRAILIKLKRRGA